MLHSWEGPVFEITIESATREIMAILNNSDLKDEELVIAFCWAEALTKLRRLMYNQLMSGIMYLLQQTTSYMAKWEDNLLQK